MLRAARLRLRIVVVLGLALAAAGTGCKTVANPAWCDVDDPAEGCAAGFRCTVDHACVLDGDGGGVCETSSQCPAERGVCDDDDRTCRACAGPDECVGRDDDRVLCATSGACVTCLGPADCDDPAAAVCDPAGACLPCATSADCAAWPEGVAAATCVDGRCLVDADTAFVDGAEGCATGDASAATPACTLADGLASAVLRDVGDVVVIAGGGPYAPVELEHAVRIHGQGRPTIRGTAGQTVVRIAGAAGDVELRGLRITGGTGAGGVGVVCEDGARCRLHDLEIDGNGLGVEIDLAGEARLTALVIHDNTSGGVSVGRSALVFASSFVWRNGTGSSPVGGLRLGNGTAAEIVVRHLTLLDNASDGSVAPGIQCEIPLAITSTILWDHARTSVSDECALSYSSTETLRDGVGNREGDPLVTATGASAELHLMPTSPCKDAGQPGVVGLEADIDGEPRDATPDMGADELP